MAQATNPNAPRAKAAAARAACVPLGLAPSGVYQELCHHSSSWSLTPRFHPCLCDSLKSVKPSAVHFCGPILQLALTGHYPAPCPMEPGLSSRDGLPGASDCLANFPMHMLVYRESSRNSTGNLSYVFTSEDSRPSSCLFMLTYA